MSDTQTTTNDLAVMIKQGFDNTPTKEEFDNLRDDVADLHKEMNERFEKVELKLDNVAYRFEVQALEKRVERLENLLKAGAPATS